MTGLFKLLLNLSFFEVFCLGWFGLPIVRYLLLALSIN